MALVKQDVSILLGKGVDTHTDAKIVQPGQLLISENCNLNKKEGSAYLRNGHDALPTTTIDRGGSNNFAPALTGIQKLTTLGDELVAITDKGLFGYSEDKQAWAWKGYISNVTNENVSVLRNSDSIYMTDSRVNNGVLVTASIGVSDGGLEFVYISVMDEESKKILTEFKEEVNTGAQEGKVRCVNKGDYVFVYYSWYDSGNKNIQVSRIDTNDVNDGYTTATYGNDYLDFDVTEFGSNALIITATDGAPFDVELSYLKDDGTSGGVSDGLPANPVTVASSYGTNDVAAINISTRYEGDTLIDTIAVFWSEQTNAAACQYRLLNTSLSTLTSSQISNGTGEQVVGVTSAYWTSNDFFVAMSIVVSGTQYATEFWSVDNAGPTSYADSVSGTIYSRPLIVDETDIYCTVVNTAGGTEQKSYFLLKANKYFFPGSGRVRHFYPVCQMLPNEGISDSYFRSYNASIIELSNGDYFLPLVRSFAIIDATSETIRTAQQTDGSVLKLNNPNSYQTVESEGCLYISAGILFEYDGNFVFENGFLNYPKILSVTDVGAGNVNIGQHLYQVTFEWSDRAGNKHFSAPSLTESETVDSSAKEISVSTNVFAYTYKIESGYFSSVENYGANVYRTPVGSTVRYRVTPASPENTDGIALGFANLSLEDNVADATIIQDEILYTNGGVLSNLATGSCVSLESYQGRLILSNRGDGDSILFSKVKRKSVGYQFNPDLDFRVLEEGGRVTATKVLDDKLIIFKDSSIHIQVGQGPSDTGSNSDYLQNPQRISANVGCPYPRSIVRFDGGIIFKSKDGFYLLDRSLNLTAIGKPVDYFKNLNTTDSVLLEDRDEIRWVHSDGVCLVYNYFQNQWSTYTNHEAVSCTVWKDKFVMAKTNGSIWVENKSSYLDDGETYQRRICTPWIAMGGLQHAERIYRIKILGEMRSRHDVTCYIAYDYEPARREEFTWNSFEELGDVSLSDAAYYDTPPTYTNQDRTYDLEIRPAIQKCEAFRLEIIDTADTDEGSPVDGGRAVWTSLTATVGVKRSTLRSSPNRRTDPQ